MSEELLFWGFGALTLLVVVRALYLHEDGERAGDRSAKALIEGTPPDTALRPMRRLQSADHLRRAIAKALWRLDWEGHIELADPIYALATERDPDMLLEIDLQTMLKRAPEATRAALERIVRRQPHRELPRLQLAAVLEQGGDLPGALDLLQRGRGSRVRIAEARLLAGLDRPDEALSLLAPLIDRLAVEARGGMGTVNAPEGNALLQEANALADAIRGATTSAGEVVLDHARRGTLDGRAGINHTLIGRAMMERSERIAVDFDLAAIDAEPEPPRTLPAQTRPSLLAWTRYGEALMRIGRFDRAERAFARIPPVAPGWFPAATGVGQSRKLQEDRALNAIQRLPPPDELDAAWEAVIPDLRVLTPLELRVVHASARPLAAALPRLAERGVQIKILPIDLRATDVPELAHLAGMRASEDRVVDAVRGLATHQLATAPVDGLLDVASAGGWVFAHELAHLVFFHLPTCLQAEADELLTLARAHPHTCSAYQQSNVDEFFAVAYADFLRHRHGPHGAPRDDEGVADGIFELIREIEGADAAALEAWDAISGQALDSDGPSPQSDRHGGSDSAGSRFARTDTPSYTSGRSGTVPS